MRYTRALGCHSVGCIDCGTCRGGGAGGGRDAGWESAGQNRREPAGFERDGAQRRDRHAARAYVGAGWTILRAVAAGGCVFDHGGARGVCDPGAAWDFAGGGADAGPDGDAGAGRGAAAGDGEHAGTNSEHVDAGSVGAGGRTPGEGAAAERAEFRWTADAESGDGELHGGAVGECGDIEFVGGQHVRGERAAAAGQFVSAERNRVHGGVADQRDSGRNERAAAGCGRGAGIQRGDGYIWRELREAGRRAGEYCNHVRHKCAARSGIRVPAQQRAGCEELFRSRRHSGVPAEPVRRIAGRAAADATSCFCSETTRASGRTGG